MTDRPASVPISPPGSAESLQVRNALPVGTILRDEDGDFYSMVIAEDATDVAEALVQLVADEFGGEPFPTDNEAIADALQYARIEWWHSCTKAWKEAEGVEWEGGDYWAPNGDGKRCIHVVSYEGSPYVLGEEAEKWMATDDD